MKRFIFLIAICAITHVVFGENTEENFGKISQSDTEIKTCSFDPDADAVVIFDNGAGFFTERGGNIYYTLSRKVRIKILKASGTKWAEVSIPFYNSNSVSEKVYDVQANSYNFESDGLVKRELDPSDCHVEKTGENWEAMKFAIPNARVGSIIEYTYKYQTDYLLSLPDWRFQWKIPVIKSRFTVGMIPFYQYQFMLQGASKFDEDHSEVSTGLDNNMFGINFKDMLYTFGMDSIPSFKSEEYVTSINDYIMKINFQLSKIIYPSGGKRDILTTWPLLVKDLIDEDNFGKYIKKCEKKESKLINVKALSELPEPQRFDSVIDFVKNNFRWNGNYRIFAKLSPHDLIKRKSGNSADINLLTIALLKDVGIDCQPVIISTRDHGKIHTEYPFYDAFNDVIILANINKASFLTDATDNYVKNRRIPMNCINDKGLVVTPKGIEWIGLYPNYLSKTQTNIFSKFENGKMESNIIVKASEYDGLYMRKNYGTDKDEIKKHIKDENEDLKDSSLTIKNMDNADGAYTLRYVVDNKPMNIDNKLYIQPFLNEIPTENPFKQKNRTYPVDMIYPYARTFVASITIPDGYTVDFLPQNKSVDNNDFELDYKINHFGKMLNISFMYEIKKAYFKPNEYQSIKSFFNDLVQTGMEKIVLKKI